MPRVAAALLPPPPALQPVSLLQVTVLQRQIADVDAQIREAQKYLEMADPDGYYVEGSAAAEAAKAQAQRAAREEQMRRQEAQRQQRLKLVGVALASLLTAGSQGVPLLIRHMMGSNAPPLLRHQADLRCSRRLVGLLLLQPPCSFAWSAGTFWGCCMSVQARRQQTLQVEDAAGLKSYPIACMSITHGQRAQLLCPVRWQEEFN